MQQTVNFTDFIFDIAIRGVVVRLVNLAGGTSVCANPIQGTHIIAVPVTEEG